MPIVNTAKSVTVKKPVIISVIPVKRKRESKTTQTSLVERVLGRVWWVIVVGAALSISAWSLYWLGRLVGMPVPLAALVSAAFDGGAVAASDLCLRWARVHGVSGLSARLAMLAFGGASAYLNVEHAILAHLPYAARLLFAAPPVIAMTILELHLRFEPRAALKRSGNLPKSLPSYSKWAWLLFPLRTIKTIKVIVRRQIDQTNPELDLSPITASLDSKVVRTWAKGTGIEVADTGRLPQDVTTAYNGASGYTELDLSPITASLDSKVVRTWAKGTGIAVADTGRLPQDVTTAYNGPQDD